MINNFKQSNSPISARIAFIASLSRSASDVDVAEDSLLLLRLRDRSLVDPLAFEAGAVGVVSAVVATVGENPNLEAEEEDDPLEESSGKKGLDTDEVGVVDSTAKDFEAAVNLVVGVTGALMNGTPLLPPSVCFFVGVKTCGV